MTKIERISYQKTANRCRNYMIVDCTMDCEQCSEELLTTQLVPHLLSFYMVELKEGHIQFWFDISGCRSVGDKLDDRIEDGSLNGIIKDLMEKGLAEEGFILSPDTVYYDKFGELKLAYIPGLGGPEKKDKEISIRESDLKRFIRNCVSDRLSRISRAGYETPDELVDRISDEVYRMFRTGDFGVFGKQDRFDPISYEMPVNLIISSYYADAD